MTINQAIIELQKLQENGKGDLDLIVYQYTGGDDEAFNIRFRVGEVESTRNVGDFVDLIIQRLGAANV